MIIKKKARVIQIISEIYPREEDCWCWTERLVSSGDIYCNSIHCDVMVLYFNSIQIPDTFADTTVHILAVTSSVLHYCVWMYFRSLLYTSLHCTRLHLERRTQATTSSLFLPPLHLNLNLHGSAVQRCVCNAGYWHLCAKACTKTSAQCKSVLLACSSSV